MTKTHYGQLFSRLLDTSLGQVPAPKWSQFQNGPERHSRPRLAFLPQEVILASQEWRGEDGVGQSGALCAVDCAVLLDAVLLHHPPPATARDPLHGQLPTPALHLRDERTSLILRYIHRITNLERKSNLIFKNALLGFLNIPKCLPQKQ